jgi:uncharacterized protein YraI
MIPFKTTLLAAGVLALSSGAALARPAVVDNDLHLRAGPGAGYGVVEVMPQGTTVDAWNCDGGWCQVSFNGIEGYASESYLDLGRAGYTSPAYRSYGYARPAYRSYAYAEPYYDNGALGFPLFPWNW